MAESNQDTIYIDIDDEITGIIDKLKSSKSTIVSLVLPKRATVLQSIVNMRLLKRASDEVKKKVILVTTEAGLIPLAGAAKMHVAKTIGGKAEVPTPPSADDLEETVNEEDTKPRPDTEITAANAGAIAVGALAGLPPKKDEVETLEMEDDVSEVPEATYVDLSGVNSVDKSKVDVVKKDRKLRIPDFNRFRLFVFGGAFLLILLIGGFVYANIVLPKAVINIKTDASSVNSSVNMTIATTATKLDVAAGTVPAKQATLPKTYTQQVATTGQINNGPKAKGTVTLRAKECTPNSLLASDLPQGAGLSVGGLTYTTDQVTKFTFDPNTSTSTCNSYVASAPTPITAQSGGYAYNKTAASFTAAGRPDVTGTGTTSGGQDGFVAVVSQADIDGAKAKITTTDPTVKAALSTQLTQAGYFPMDGTYNAGAPVVTTSANVGDPATTISVTEVLTYTMLGVHQADLKALVDNSVGPQIDIVKQSILDEGLSAATFNVQSSNDTTAVITMQSSAVVGPKLDDKTIKKQVLGMKSGDVKALFQSNPDVTSVDVKFSPFWVNSVPKNISKVTVNIAKPTKATTPSNTSTTTNGTNP